MWGRRGGDELDAVERYAERRWLAVVLVTLAFAAFGLSLAMRLHEAGQVGAGDSAGARAQGAGLVWAVWSLAVLRATFGSGGVQWSARQRRVLNDELAAANRRTAAGVGY